MFHKYLSKNHYPSSKVAYIRIFKYIIKIRISRSWNCVYNFIIIVLKNWYSFSLHKFWRNKQSVKKYLSYIFCRWCLWKTKAKTRETLECHVSYMGRCSLSVYHICILFSLHMCTSHLEKTNVDLTQKFLKTYYKSYMLSNVYGCILH